jgi:DedD protein
VEGPVKERLTGAVILLAALVVIVSEMLSGPGSKPAVSAAPPAQSAEAGAPLRTYSMDLRESAPTDATAQATLAPQSAVAPATQAVPAPSSAPAQPEVETPAPAPVAAAEPPAAQPKPDSASRTAPKTGAWWTQLGSFSSRDNAERLAQKLRTAGFAIDVSKVGAAGKELYRVRAGPVQGRAEAVTLQSRLAADGHKSTIVAP